MTIIDFTYSKYNKLWKDDRWKFSGDMVKLTIKQKHGLEPDEQHTLDMMNRIVDEHDGNWMEGNYSNYYNGKQTVKIKQPR